MNAVVAKLKGALEFAGQATLDFFTEVGLVTQFMARILSASVRPPYRVKLLLQQAEFVGVGSVFIILLTGFFTGAVFTLQSAQAFQRVGMESMVGSTVLLAVARELAPVLTSLMVTGRVGSAMATELGTMRVTEQIDAMEVLAVDPINYLVVPRVFASAVMVPCLSLIFLVVATVGSFIVGVSVLGIDEGAFMARIEWFLDPFDFTHGLYKAIVFGVVLSLIGCYKGYNAAGGARGVGMATTQAVVIGSISIFVLDYVLTSILLIGAPD
ncbi:MAG: ABC transporter permease [Deltaproteobacteria bacterium]|nr:ABC transporter permease [Deltaproteobacteria bacterium]